MFRGTLQANDPTDDGSPATGGVVVLDFAVQRVFKGEASERQVAVLRERIDDARRLSGDRSTAAGWRRGR